MIYSVVSLLFSLTVNGFDLVEIPLACSFSPSISPAWSLSSFISDPSLENGAKNGNMLEPTTWWKKLLFCFLVWVQDPFLSLPCKLYSSRAVIQLHPWPWSYCSRLNGSACAEITVNAPLSSSKGLQMLSYTKTPGTLSAYWADIYMDIHNPCTCSPFINQKKKYLKCKFLSKV